VRKKKRKGERERLTSGAQASARAKKKKERERERERERAWAGAGKGWRAAGPFGPKGEKVRFRFFLFFFQTPFKTTFLFKFKSNSFKVFLKKIL
jgi:hypothetical protein